MSKIIFSHPGQDDKAGSPARVISIAAWRARRQRLGRSGPQDPIPPEPFNFADHIDELHGKSLLLVHALVGMGELFETSEVPDPTKELRPLQKLSLDLHKLAETLRQAATMPTT